MQKKCPLYYYITIIDCIITNALMWKEDCIIIVAYFNYLWTGVQPVTI